MNEQEQQIRIAIVDDHEMFRAGVIATLQPHFDIVGQAADVEGSVAMIAQTKPDVVLLDVHVPGGEGGGGAEILVKSRAYSPNTVFLALSVSDSPQAARPSRRAPRFPCAFGHRMDSRSASANGGAAA